MTADTQTELDTLYRLRFSAEERATKDRLWQVLCRHYFQRFIRAEQDTLLDIGCGYGEFSRHIQAHHKIAVDMNPDARDFLPPGAQFLQSSADDMRDIKTGSVDVAFSSNFLEHLPSKAVLDRVLAEILRVLRPGGRYIALQPNIRFCYDRYWDYYDHHTALSDRSCAEAFGLAGFEVEEMIPKFLPYTVKSALPAHPVLVRAYLALPFAWRFLGEQFLAVGRKPVPRS